MNTGSDTAEDVSGTTSDLEMNPLGDVSVNKNSGHERGNASSDYISVRRHAQIEKCKQVNCNGSYKLTGALNRHLNCTEGSFKLAGASNSDVVDSAESNGYAPTPCPP